MTRIVATVLLALLLPPPTVASEVNGKALICFQHKSLGWRENSPVTGNRYSGFKFIDGEVEDYVLELVGTKMEIRRVAVDIVEVTNDKFKETLTTIEWGTAYSLDRQTLEITFTMDYADYVKVYPCKVYANFAEYNDAFEIHRVEEDRALKEGLKDNKI